MENTHDECTCGCEHDHEHNDSCGCGHDHEHNDSCGCGHHHKRNQVMVGTMGNAVVGTLTAYTSENISVVEVNMHAILKELAAWIKERGGFINQLKCSMKNPEMTLILTMLGEEIFRKESHDSTETVPNQVKINLMNIAFNVEPLELKAKLEEILSRLCKK